MRAIQITAFGGPEVLHPTELPDPVPGDGWQLCDVTSAGVNYADTHQVEDSYLSRTTLPLVPGTEVVGRLEDGTRVAAFAMAGGYAQKALVLPDLSFPLPDAVSDGQALSLMVQGLTAWHSCAPAPTSHPASPSSSTPRRAASARSRCSSRRRGVPDG
ncbi:MAG: NADPH:quinone oxidoreductase family protein [Frankiales bacterium]|nr:NADPH:quinone oxidoreductase family protein [Frankiales bacterium]